MNPTPSATVEQNQQVSHAQIEPVCHSPAEIPTEPKAFTKWLRAQGWDRWPEELRAKAIRAFASISARDQRAWNQSYALRKAAKADWSAFTTALAAYRAEAV